MSLKTFMGDLLVLYNVLLRKKVSKMHRRLNNVGDFYFLPLSKVAEKSFKLHTNLLRELTNCSILTKWCSALSEILKDEIF